VVPPTAFCVLRFVTPPYSKLATGLCLSLNVCKKGQEYFGELCLGAHAGDVMAFSSTIHLCSPALTQLNNESGSQVYLQSLFWDFTAEFDMVKTAILDNVLVCANVKCVE
jgi:hypothetical protein